MSKIMFVCLFGKGFKTGKSEVRHLPEGPYYLKCTVNVLVAFSTEYMGQKDVTIANDLNKHFSGLHLVPVLDSFQSKTGT